MICLSRNSVFLHRKMDEREKKIKCFICSLFPVSPTLLDTSAVESFPLPAVPARMQDPFGHQAGSRGVPLKHCLSFSSHHLTKASIRDPSIQTVIKSPQLSHGTSLVAQWVRLCASSGGGMGSTPGWGNKIPHAFLHDQKIKSPHSI